MAESHEEANDEPLSPAQHSLFKSSMLMASGTLVSRLLGFLRNTLLIAAVGVAMGAADAFQAANTLPNMVYNMLAAGVFNAVLIPQIVRALKHKSGSVYVSRLLTAAGSILFLLTALAMLGAPLLLTLTSSGFPADVRALAITFSLWCLPQLFFYGVYNLFGEVLNARGIFGPFMWAPVLNNLIAIAGLGYFIYRWGVAPEVLPASDFSSQQVLVLAGSATLGVILQALILLIPLRRSGVKLRLDFHFRGTDFGSATRVAMWTFATLLVSQVGILSTSNIASRAVRWGTENGQVIPSLQAYNTAFMIFMLPQALIGLSITTAMFTRLANNAADGNQIGMARNYERGVRLITLLSMLAAAALIPAAQPLMQMILPGFPASAAAGYASVLVALALGVPAVGIGMISQRVFYALENAKPVFLIGILPMLLQLLVGWTTYAVADPRWWTVGAAAAETAARLLHSLISVAWVGYVVRTVNVGRIITNYTKYFTGLCISAFAGWGVLHLVGPASLQSSGGARFADAFWKACLVGVVVALVFYLFLRVTDPEGAGAAMRALASKLPGRKARTVATAGAGAAEADSGASDEGADLADADAEPDDRTATIDAVTDAPAGEVGSSADSAAASSPVPEPPTETPSAADIAANRDNVTEKAPDTERTGASRFGSIIDRLLNADEDNHDPLGVLETPSERATRQAAGDTLAADFASRALSIGLSSVESANTGQIPILRFKNAAQEAAMPAEGNSASARDAAEGSTGQDLPLTKADAARLMAQLGTDDVAGDAVEPGTDRTEVGYLAAGSPADGAVFVEPTSAAEPPARLGMPIADANAPVSTPVAGVPLGDPLEDASPAVELPTAPPQARFAPAEPETIGEMVAEVELAEQETAEQADDLDDTLIGQLHRVDVPPPPPADPSEDTILTELDVTSLAAPLPPGDAAPAPVPSPTPMRAAGTGFHAAAAAAMGTEAPPEFSELISGKGSDLAALPGGDEPQPAVAPVEHVAPGTYAAAPADPVVPVDPVAPVDPAFLATGSPADPEPIAPSQIDSVSAEDAYRMTLADAPAVMPPSIPPVESPAAALADELASGIDEFAEEPTAQLTTPDAAATEPTDVYPAFAETVSEAAPAEDPTAVDLVAESDVAEGPVADLPLTGLPPASSSAAESTIPGLGTPPAADGPEPLPPASPFAPTSAASPLPFGADSVFAEPPAGYGPSGPAPDQGKFDPTKLTVALAALVIVAGLAFAVVNLSSTPPMQLPMSGLQLGQSAAHQEGEEPAAAPVVTPTVTGATVFSWQDDDGDHADEAGAITDGNPETLWNSRYFTLNEFAPETAISVMIALEQESPVSRILVTNRGSGGEVVVRKPTEGNPRAGEVLATLPLQDGTTSIDLPEGTTANELSLSFNQLPTDDEGLFRAKISEITVE